MSGARRLRHGCSVGHDAVERRGAAVRAAGAAEAMSGSVNAAAANEIFTDLNVFMLLPKSTRVGDVRVFT